MMKKVLLVFLSFYLIFFGSFFYTFGYEIKPEIKERMDIKLENFYTKIGEKDLDVQIKVYKKLKIKLNILKDKYKTGIKSELVSYVYDELKKKYSEVFKKYLVEKKENKLDNKDLGNGFILKQTLDKTYIVYKGKEFYFWTHTSKNNPFIWDEGCDLLSEKLEDGETKDKQIIWESLGIKKQKQCLKEYYNKSISVSKIDSRFYTINNQGYEGVGKKLFDSKNGKFYNKMKVSLYKISKIEIGKSGIFILYKGNRGHEGGVLFIDKDTDEQKILFHNTDTGTEDKDYIETTNFKLMLNKKIKIFYKGQNLVEKEKIVNLDN